MGKDSNFRARELGEQINATTLSFLRGRLNETASIEWALDLGSEHAEERQAIRDLFAISNVKLSEPFRSAWLWLLESWSAQPHVNQNSRYAIRLGSRGEVDGETLRTIVDLVRPWPKLKKLESWRWYGGPPPPKKPKKLEHLVYISVTSGEMFSLRDADIENRLDASASDELADRLESALMDGLHVAQRLGWVDTGIDRTSDDVRRVYPLSQDSADPESDPDRYRHGFAPVTKLLFQVVERQAGIDERGARARIARWKDSKWLLLRRLWAGLARRHDLASGDDISRFCLTLTDEEFWRPSQYPEFAELRALRFNDMDDSTREVLERRIVDLPPAKMWSRKPKAKELVRYQNVRSAIELRRIIAAGGHISEASKRWESLAAKKFEVPAVQSVDFDFEPTVLTDWTSDGAGAFDDIDVSSALDVLESMLSEDNRFANSGAARTYISTHISELLQVIRDMPAAGAKSPEVWRQILQLSYPAQPNQTQDSHHPSDGNSPVEEQHALATNIAMILRSWTTLELLPIVETLAGWLVAWMETMRSDELFADLWLQVWPAAVQATNNRRVQSTEDDVAGIPEANDTDHERLAHAALNTAVGLLMTALLRLCPKLTDVPRPFEKDPLKKMRDVTMAAVGAARLQVLHRFLSSLEYMRKADPEWADRNLLDPLNTVNGADIEIWDAISRNPVLRYETMLIIGERMAHMAYSEGLSLETRARLGERVVYRALIDRSEGKKPSVSDEVVQQMLRLGSDRLRAACGHIIGVFIESSSRTSSPERQFREVVAPFFESVWPKERTLRARSLSDALAALPAKTGAAFAEAVFTIERFLTPFDCWSLHEYGLYGRDFNGKTLRKIQGPKEATALLHLLDDTIGSEENAVRPLDLDRALVAIREADPKLIRDKRYARLSALERR